MKYVKKLFQKIGKSLVLVGSAHEKSELINLRKKENNMSADFTLMKDVAQQDLQALQRAEQSYGDSWKRRGGVGAFMMLARKFDRIEHQSKKHGWDIFEAGEVYSGEAGLLDDIRDLRRYLLLVEQEILAQTSDEPEETINTDYVEEDV
jgi:hypothetical protein